MRFLRPAGLLSGFMVEDTSFTTPELIHAGEQWVPRNFEIRTHHHECWEIYFQAHGETSWATQDTHFRVGKNGFLAVAPGIVHELEQKQTSKHHFFFAAIDMNIVLDRLPVLRPWWTANRVLIADNASAVEAPFRQLIREVTLDLPMRSAAIRCAIDSILIEATRACSHSESNIEGAIPQLFMHAGVLRAKQLIDAHPGDRWNVADLAAIVGLSTSHFAEKFQQDTGMSPHQYLTERRLAAAKELLLTTDLAVTTIGLELGFSSGQHFSGAFRRQTGQTPSHFRSSGRRN